MTRVFLAAELEGVATFWRIRRADGVTLGFTSHDRNLAFDGVTHRAAPGMLPSAIRRTAGLTGDSAEMHGALAHDSIAADDLSAGRYDGARVEVGAVDWETLERAVLYHGTIGTVSEEGRGFAADLRSAKAELERDTIPRTSPTCRARFCGPGCTLSAARFTYETALMAIDRAENRAVFSLSDPARFVDGEVRWLDGPHRGLAMAVMAADANGLLLETTLDPALGPGARVLLREGCDHTLATCAGRFDNVANFQGEPFLPGNDLLARYPAPP